MCEFTSNSGSMNMRMRVIESTGNVFLTTNKRCNIQNCVPQCQITEGVRVRV